MKHFLKLLCIVFFSSNNMQAQLLDVDVAYQYLYSNQWDKAIQTYNFSRPFLTEKQPLLIHGLHVGCSYRFPSELAWQHGLSISYALTRSVAENENFTNSLNLHQLHLGYLFHYDISPYWHTEIALQAMNTGLFRRIYGEPLLVDDTRSKAFGIGAALNLKIGYALRMNDRLTLSPYLAAGYAPYLYAPAMESVLNQTQTLVTKNWTGVLTVQVGCSITIQQRQRAIN